MLSDQNERSDVRMRKKKVPQSPGQKKGAKIDKIMDYWPVNGEDKCTRTIQYPVKLM
jgi:hypothetical protein